MKKLLVVTLALLFLQLEGIAQTTTELETDSEISEVTLFLQGAQIRRTATAELVNGKTLLILKNLSPVLDPKKYSGENSRHTYLVDRQSLHRFFIRTGTVG